MQTVFITGLFFGLIMGLIVGVTLTVLVMIYRNQAETKAAYYYGIMQGKGLLDDELKDGTGPQ